MENQTTDEAKCRILVEKKSVINLIEAFSVAIKHYLRGEDGIYYRYSTEYLPFLYTLLTCCHYQRPLPPRKILACIQFPSQKNLISQLLVPPYSQYEVES